MNSVSLTLLPSPPYCGTEGWGEVGGFDLKATSPGAHKRATLSPLQGGESWTA